jgi:3-hydroxyisobutyrate dehydrogenase-like beta-hydroxyacid dehydrogenase
VIKFARDGGLYPSRVVEAVGTGAAASGQLSNLGPKIILAIIGPASSSS